MSQYITMIEKELIKSLTTATIGQVSNQINFGNYDVIIDIGLKESELLDLIEVNLPK